MLRQQIESGGQGHSRDTSNTVSLNEFTKGDRLNSRARMLALVNQIESSENAKEFLPELQIFLASTQGAQLSRETYNVFRELSDRISKVSTSTAWRDRLEIAARFPSGSNHQWLPLG